MYQEDLASYLWFAEFQVQQYIHVILPAKSTESYNRNFCFIHKSIIELKWIFFKEFLMLLKNLAKTPGHSTGYFKNGLEIFLHLY